MPWYHPLTPFKFANLGTGSGATVTFAVSAGKITTVTASPAAAGSGYPVSATIYLTVTGGSGTLGVVKATTNSSGQVSAFATTPTNPGSGYTAETGAATSPYITVIKATAACLKSLMAINTSGADAYIQVFNAPQTGQLAAQTIAGAIVNAPVLGTTMPDAELYVASGEQASLPLPVDGQSFNTALSIFSATAEGGGTGSASGVMVWGNYA
jgi:hypothetical protein